MSNLDLFFFSKFESHVAHQQQEGMREKIVKLHLKEYHKK